MRTFVRRPTRAYPDAPARWRWHDDDERRGLSRLGEVTVSTNVEHRAAGRRRRPGAWIGFALVVGGFAAFWVLAASSPGTIESLWSRLRDLPLLVEAVVWLIAFPLTLSMAVWESSWAEWIRVLLVFVFTVTWSYLFYPKQQTRSSAKGARPAVRPDADGRRSQEPHISALTEEPPRSGVKRALVIYESMYGNTEQIGKAVGDGLGEVMPVDVVEVGSAPTELSGGYRSDRRRWAHSRPRNEPTRHSRGRGQTGAVTTRIVRHRRARVAQLTDPTR